MKFAHLADTHLGYRQYGLLERERDFYNVFSNIIDKIIDADVDFVVHSGDLFETSRPSTDALLIVQKGLNKLHDAEIPVYAVAGNHDITMRKNSIPPQVLFKQSGIKLISPIKEFYREKEFFIGGLPFIPKNQNNHLKNELEKLSNKASSFDNKILVLHQGIDKYLPFQYELEIGDLPTNFSYYAMGHVHNYVNDEFGKGRLVYPGSTEIWKSSEIKDYKLNGKGFCLVDLNDGEVEVERVPIDLPREFISETINYDYFRQKVLQIKNQIVDLNNKPLLDITVEGEGFNSTEVFDFLNKELSDLCLMLRPNFNINDSEDLNILENGDNLEVNALIAKKLQDLENDDVVDLAINLLDTLSKDKIDDAQDTLNVFYNDYFNKEN